MPSTHDRRREPRGDRSAAPWLLVLGLVVAVVVAAAVLMRADGGEGEGEAIADEQVAHVHGLGLNPADGTLYAATHYGLFEVPESGRATRIGFPRDLMGFTVAGPDLFLASGHPAPNADPLFESARRPLLGLIRSDDRGETWEPVSLLGEVDFHALRAAHGRVYGYDATSGRFMVSGDGEDWEVRSELPMGDFAVAPDDPDHVIAMTEEGLAESLDGGRTWSAVGGPAAAFLSWDRADGLWAAGVDGAIHVRTPSGWSRRGALPGSPQALLVADGLAYAAADAGRSGIYVSDDGGRSWQLRYADHP